MAKTDAQVVQELLDRMERKSNEAKAREITRVLGKRIRQRVRQRESATSGFAGQIRAAQSERYSPIPIEGEPLSSTILRDRGVC